MRPSHSSLNVTRGNRASLYGLFCSQAAARFPSQLGRRLAHSALACCSFCKTGDICSGWMYDLMCPGSCVSQPEGLHTNRFSGSRMCIEGASLL